MINIDTGTQTFKIRNNWDEITLGELEHIQKILEGDSWVANWKNIINLLSGWPTSQMNDWNIDNFKELTNMILPLDDIKLTDKIIAVTVYDRNFVYQPSNMSARIARDVEKAYYSDRYLSLVVATLFHEVGLENDNWEVIESKADCLRKATMDNFISILWTTNAKVLFNLNKRAKNAAERTV